MFETVQNLPENRPFLMLNALWFKPDGGAARYHQYLNASAPYAEKYGGSAETIAVPQGDIFGDFDADLVFFVRWPDKQAFLNLVNDPDYRKVARLREEAIMKSYLVPCLPL
jgi:uncharacterized protein (DUF1330 family)